MRVDNDTRFAHTATAMLALDGGDALIVVIKASFRLSSRGRTLHADPLPIFAVDQYHPTGSIRYPGDVSLIRSGTDVICLGHVYAPDGEPTGSCQATLNVGNVRHTIHAFGDRRWEVHRASWRPSLPEPVLKIPLGYERAFGGADFVFNPVGIGVASSSSAEGRALPNLENPHALLVHPDDKPTPASFAAIAAHWSPRREYAGTYDEHWSRTHAPLLPADFDARFSNVAPPELHSVVSLKGGEHVELHNLDANKAIISTVPRVGIRVLVGDNWIIPNLDLILLEPDQDRISLTFRASIDITGSIDLTPRIRIFERKLVPLGRRNVA